MKGFGKCLVLLLLAVASTTAKAQVSDSSSDDLGVLKHRLDSCEQLFHLQQNRLDSLTLALGSCHDDKTLLETRISLQLENIQNLENQTIMLRQALERLEQEGRFQQEKEQLYKEAKDKEIEYLQNNLREKEQALETERQTVSLLTAERNQYLRANDSLKSCLIEAEKKNIRTNEELKYTQQRAKEAEARVSAATAKKKKVVPIQGIAMKTFRTPNWSIAPDKIEDGSIAYRIVNKNGGNVEFDYTAGASVMLWDLTKSFGKAVTDTLNQKHIDIKKFDQDFSYSLGLYVGFGGSNLFKNFYVGPSFKFLDFFHLSTGVNICEYEMLTGNFKEGDILPTGLSLTDQISKVWKLKPFVSLSFDLDFISYIKK